MPNKTHILILFLLSINCSLTYSAESNANNNRALIIETSSAQLIKKTCRAITNDDIPVEMVIVSVDRCLETECGTALLKALYKIPIFSIREHLFCNLHETREYRYYRKKTLPALDYLEKASILNTYFPLSLCPIILQYSQGQQAQEKAQ